MSHAKADLLKELDQARVDLWGLLDQLDAEIEIYPGWKKREFFAHIAGWEATVYEVFHDHLTRQPAKNYAFSDLEEANNYFVSTRQSVPLEGVKLECDINRFAIKTLLAGIPAEQFNERIRFPWGENTIAEFIEGAIQHERDHASDIGNLLAR